MLKVVARITTILLVASLLAVGLHYLVNGNLSRGSLTPSDRLTAQNQIDFSHSANTSPGFQPGSPTNTRQFAGRNGFGEREFLNGPNLSRGLSGIVQSLFVISLITLIVIPVRKIFIRMSHKKPLKTA